MHCEMFCYLSTNRISYKLRLFFFSVSQRYVESPEIRGLDLDILAQQLETRPFMSKYGSMLAHGQKQKKWGKRHRFKPACVWVCVSLPHDQTKNVLIFHSPWNENTSKDLWTQVESQKGDSKTSSVHLLSSLFPLRIHVESLGGPLF